MIYRVVLFIMIILSVGFFVQPWLPTSKTTENAPKSVRIAGPDAWMENVDATFMNKDGKVMMKVHTPSLTHYAKNDTTFLKTPQFLLYRRSSLTPWRIQSGEGSATQGMNNIRLSNTVTLHHPGDALQPATWVNTDQLMIHPNEKIAETAEMATFTQPSFTIRGKGLHADLNTGDIRLLSETRGEYAFNQ